VLAIGTRLEFGFVFADHIHGLLITDKGAQQDDTSCSRTYQGHENTDYDL